jgi:hypothetical protein
MTTDTHAADELEVPDFKDRLWHELAELHPENRRSQSAVGSGLGRRRSRRPLAATVAAAAIVIVGLVAAQLVGTSSEAPLMGRIAAATDEALASSVVHWVDEQTPPGEAGPSRVTEFWTDETSSATRILDRDTTGDPVLDVGPLTAPSLESPAHPGQRVVDYCTRTYVDHQDTGGASTDIELDGLRELRDAVAAGQWVEDGTEMVDGRDLIRLVQAEERHGSGHVLLVDPDSYLPVRARGTLSTGEAYSQTYEYVPRTPDSLAGLRPPIPSGFTESDDLGFDTRPRSCPSP